MVGCARASRRPTVAPAALDGEVDGEAALAVERGDVEVAVEDLDLGVAAMSPAVTSPGPLASSRSVDRLVAVECSTSP